MSSPNPHTPLSASYDQGLLATAPAATRAAKQEGYNVDLLDEKRHRSVPPPSTPDVEAARSAKETHGSPIVNVPAVAIPSLPKKVSFWRKPQGLFTLVLLAVIIVGAVVGGAVGGTVGKKNRNHGLSSAPTNGQQPILPGSTSVQQPEQGTTQQQMGPTSPTASSPNATPSSSASSGGQGGLSLALPTISLGPG